MDEPSFILPRDEGRVTGRRLRLLGDGRYHLRDGEFTTCPVESEDWKISVSALELDPAANVAVARSARLEIRGVPIFYLPRFSFQLDRSRKKADFLPPPLVSAKRADWNWKRRFIFISPTITMQPFLPDLSASADFFCAATSAILFRAQTATPELNFYPMTNSTTPAAIGDSLI